MEIRFVAYDRLGARRGVVPNPLEALVNKAYNDLTTLNLHYDRNSPNSTFLEGEPEIAVETFKNDTWEETRGGRLRCLTVDFDHLEEVPTRRYDFIHIGEALRGQLVYGSFGLPTTDEGKVSFGDTNVGRVLDTVWANAVDRGWTGFSNSFNTTTDSAGNPWDKTFTISFDISTNLLGILNQFVAQGLIDIEWEGRTLHVYNKGVITPNLSLGDNPLRFAGSGPGGASTDSAPEFIDQSSLATHLVVLGENGLRWEFETGAPVAEGRRELIVSYSGVDDIETARVLAAPTILKAQNHLKNTTRQFHLTPETKVLPIHDYDVGDWVDIQRGLEFESMQIIALNLQVNVNGIQGYVTLGDKIDGLLETMYQRIQGLTGGVANEGGTPPTPSIRQPNPPAGLSVGTSAQVDSMGKTYGSITLAWLHDGKDVLGEVVDIKSYTAYYRPMGLTEWRPMFTTSNKSGAYSPLETYDPYGVPYLYEFMVQATSTRDVVSADSQSVYTEMVDDVTPPAKPSTPTSSVWLRNVYVAWDGKGINDSNIVVDMPADFRDVIVWEATAADMTGKVEVGRMVGASTLVLGSRPADVTRWYALQAYDRSGNASAMSAVTSVTPTDLVDEATIKAALDKVTGDIGANVSATTDARAIAEQGVDDAAAAKLLADAAQADATQGVADALASKKLADAAQADADAAQSAADAAAADAANVALSAEAAQAAADAANQAAMDAAGLAGSKGKVWFQTAAPAAGTSYSWTGAVNNSSSLKKLNGVTQLTNIALDPRSVTAAFSPNNVHWSSTLVTGIPATPTGVTTATKGIKIAEAGLATIASWYSLDRLSGRAGQRTIGSWVWVSADGYSGTLSIGGVYGPTQAIPAQTWIWLTAVSGAGGGYSVLEVRRTDGANANMVDYVYATGITSLDGATAPTTHFDGSSSDDRQNDLWADIDDNNKPYRWDSASDTWILSDDPRIATALNNAATADGKAVTAQNAADAAAGDAAIADGKADAAQADATAAQTQADKAVADALAAKNLADQAQADATKAISDAALAADDAEAARLLAVAAQSTADGKTTVSQSAPTVGDLSGKKANSMWTQVVAGKAVGAWYKATDNATEWTSMPFDPVMIPQINIGTGTFGDLNGIRLAAASVKAKSLFIGSYANLIPNGDGSLGVPYGTTAMPLDTTTVPPNKAVFGSFLAVPTQRGSVDAADLWVIDKARSHKIAWTTKADVANSRYYILIGFYDRNRVFLNSVEAASNVTMGTVWTDAEYTLKPELIPANTVYAQLILFPNHTNGSAVANQWYSDLSMREMESGELVVDGSVKARMMAANSVEADAILAGAVKAGKLEADLALLTRIIAGPVGGTHAEMDPNGFHVFAADTVDGVPNEVVRLGVAATNDYLTILKSNGELAASISDDGKISGMELWAKNSIWYKGREMTDLLNDLPQGLIAYGDFYTGVNNISTEYGIFDIQATLLPGRAYEITLLGGTVSSVGGGGAIHIIRAAGGGVAPTLSSGEVKRFEHSYSDNLPKPIAATFLYYPTITSPTIMRFMWSINKYGGGVAGWQGGEMSIKDVGRQRRTAGTLNTGGGSTAAPITVSSAVFNTTDSANYLGSGGVYAYDQGHMYQGLSPAGFGNLSSIALFPDMTGVLANATVNWIRVYFNFQHWYNNSGGLARIGVHGHSSLPGSFSSSGVQVASGGWPKPGARWLDLPASTFASFKSGAFKGLTLEGDGSYNTYGYADRPTIEINYTK